MVALIRALVSTPCSECMHLLCPSRGYFASAFLFACRFASMRVLHSCSPLVATLEKVLRFFSSKGDDAIDDQIRIIASLHGCPSSDRRTPVLPHSHHSPPDTHPHSHRHPHPLTHRRGLGAPSCGVFLGRGPWLWQRRK